MPQDELKEQRRSRGIAMTPEERDLFLQSERVCRVASVGSDGAPHVTPLWFIWDGTAVWLNSIVRSQRWVDLQTQPRTAVVVDGGVEFADLHGVEIEGSVEAIGDVPRTAEPNDVLAPVELAFARKYGGGDVFFPDGRHAWLRVVPTKISSWDFRKNQALRSPR